MSERSGRRIPPAERSALYVLPGTAYICFLVYVPPAKACICQHTAHITLIAIKRCGNTRTASWRTKVKDQRNCRYVKSVRNSRILMKSSGSPWSSQHRSRCQIYHRCRAVVAPLVPLPLGWSGYLSAVLLISRTDGRVAYKQALQLLSRMWLHGYTWYPSLFSATDMSGDMSVSSCLSMQISLLGIQMSPASSVKLSVKANLSAGYTNVPYLLVKKASI